MEWFFFGKKKYIWCHSFLWLSWITTKFHLLNVNKWDDMSSNLESDMLFILLVSNKVKCSIKEGVNVTYTFISQNVDYQILFYTIMIGLDWYNESNSVGVFKLEIIDEGFELKVYYVFTMKSFTIYLDVWKLFL